jgi:hypothetical protein
MPIPHRWVALSFCLEYLLQMLSTSTVGFSWMCSVGQVSSAFASTWCMSPHPPCTRKVVQRLSELWLGSLCSVHHPCGSVCSWVASLLARHAHVSKHHVEALTDGSPDCVFSCSWVASLLAHHAHVSKHHVEELTDGSPDCILISYHSGSQSRVLSYFWPTTIWMEFHWEHLDWNRLSSTFWAFQEQILNSDMSLCVDLNTMILLEEVPNNGQLKIPWNQVSLEITIFLSNHMFLRPMTPISWFCAQNSVFMLVALKSCIKVTEKGKLLCEKDYSNAGTIYSVHECSDHMYVFVMELKTVHGHCQCQSHGHGVFVLATCFLATSAVASSCLLLKSVCLLGPWRLWWCHTPCTYVYTMIYIYIKQMTLHQEWEWWGRLLQPKSHCCKRTGMTNIWLMVPSRQCLNSWEKWNDTLVSNCLMNFNKKYMMHGFTVAVCSRLSKLQIKKINKWLLPMKWNTS